MTNLIVFFLCFTVLLRCWGDSWKEAAKNSAMAACFIVVVLLLQALVDYLIARFW